MTSVVSGKLIAAALKTTDISMLSAWLGQMKGEFAEDDDMSVYDDAEGVNEEDDDEEVEAALAVFASIFEGVMPASTEVVRRAPIDVTRENMDYVVKNFTPRVGVDAVVAAPGTGKTSVFPEKVVRALASTGVLVAPYDGIVASVAANHEKTWVGPDGIPTGKDAGLFYMTMDSFKEMHLKGKALTPDVLLFFDEAQLGGEYRAFLDEFVNRYGSSNQVVLLCGTYERTDLEVPKDVELRDASSYRAGAHDRVLVLYPDNAAARRVVSAKAVGKDFLIDHSRLNESVNVLRACNNMSMYTIHAAAGSAIGLDVGNLQAVVLSDSWSDGGHVRYLDRSMQVQLACRVGRRGQKGYCYLKGGKLSGGSERKPVVVRGVYRPVVDKFFRAADVAAARERRVAKERENRIARRMASAAARRAEEAKFEKCFPVGVVKDSVEQTVVNVGATPHTCESLATLPLASYPGLTSSVGNSRYDLGTMDRFYDSGGDVSSYVVHNYNYFVVQSKEFVAKRDKRAVFRGGDPMDLVPAFYDQYLDMRRWIVERGVPFTLPKKVRYVVNGREGVGDVGRVVELGYLSFGLGRV